MKKGTTATLEVFIDDLHNIELIDSVIFTFSKSFLEESESVILTKKYPNDETIVYDLGNNVFNIALTQEETTNLPNTFYIEAQVNFKNKAVAKTNIQRYFNDHTLATEIIEDNTADGEKKQKLELNVKDYVKFSIDYADLGNKPKINDIELVNNKTGEDLKLVNNESFLELKQLVEDHDDIIDELDVDISTETNVRSTSDKLLQDHINTIVADTTNIKSNLKQESTERESKDNEILSKIADLTTTEILETNIQSAKDYADTQDTTILQSAKDYTDEKISKIENYTLTEADKEEIAQRVKELLNTQ